MELNPRALNLNPNTRPQLSSRNRIAILGDSIIGAASGTFTLAGLSAQAGLATANTASPHHLQAGSAVSVFADADAYNGIHTVISTPSPTSFTYAVPATAAATATPTAPAYNHGSKVMRCAYHIANGMSGNRMLLVANAGKPGDTTAGMLQRVSRDVLPAAPDTCIVSGGINDINWSPPVETSETIGNLISICNVLSSQGIAPILTTCRPTGSPYHSTSTAAKIFALNAAIRAFCAASGVPLLDSFRSLVDPTSSKHNILANATQDGLHLYFFGALLEADIWANLFRSIAPALDTLPSGAGDTWEIGDNILSNPVFTKQTGGSVGGGITGSPPADWAVNRWGALTAQISYEPRTVDSVGDQAGCSFKLSCQSPGSGCGVQIANTTQVSAAFLVAGPGQYIFDGWYALSGATVAFTSVSIGVSFTIDGRTITNYAFFSNGPVPAGKDISTVFATTPITIPAGASSLTLSISHTPEGAGTFDVRMGRIAMRKI